MCRALLERRQVWIYLAAVLCGLALGGGLDAAEGDRAGALLWPLLGALLYATFCQVPLERLKDALRERRFLIAVVAGNFLCIPFLAYGLALLLPDDPAVRLGVLLVLLAPCTDWFITFTRQGGGDTALATAVTPLNLLLQIVFLPVYLWAFLGMELAPVLAWEDVLAVFLGLVLLPLGLALSTRRWVARSGERRLWLERLAWLQVPLLAGVVFLVAFSQVGLVLDRLPILGPLALAFGAYLALAALLARGLAGAFGLGVGSGRALAFSLGTRNSFVVLPYALALPSGMELAVVIVVFQSLVELFGMAAYLWGVPRHLFPDREVSSP